MWLNSKRAGCCKTQPESKARMRIHEETLVLKQIISAEALQIKTENKICIHMQQTLNNLCYLLHESEILYT